MNKTQIWLDADSCPLQARNFLAKKANELNLKIYFVITKSFSCTCSNM